MTKETPAQVRVAIVGPSLRFQGGQSVQANLLTRNWRDDPAANVHFVPVDPELPRLLKWVERIPYLRTVVRMPFYLMGLWYGMQDTDIVHIFSASYWSFLLAPAPAWLMARLRGKRSLMNYRSGEARNHLSRSRIAVRVLRAVDRNIVPSRYLVDVFRDFNVRAEAIPNTVDASQFRYRLRKPLLPRLVCSRGFHPYYSVDLVVRAFDLLKKTHPASQLCLVGKGPIEKEIRDLVKTLGLKDVEFAGAVSHSEIARCYEQNDIFINASWVDNMPVSILEAFASGTPVVTTAPDGIRYIVEHERTGLLCEPGDWRALTENVVRLLQNPEFAEQLASNAYEESRRYQWDVVRTQWLDVYRSLHVPKNASTRDTISTGRE
jgi:glycosyltransferase involved in cell wall biosynthesis